MGKKDVLAKMYLGQNEIFADAFNYYLFDGKPYIRPSDLVEKDTTELSAIYKTDKLFTNQKFRDVLRLCNIRHFGQTTLILLGIEGQSDVHYAMPVRDYLYDALNYAAQVDDIKRNHDKAKDLTDAEKISGFSKKDHILPVITLCICFDNNTWDGPKSLYDMFSDIPQEILKYVNNYKLNLIAPAEIDDFGKFKSELGALLKFIQISDNKTATRDILNSGEYDNISTNTVKMINEYTGAKISTENAEGGHINMGNAWKELMEDIRIEGQTEGQSKGEEMLSKLLKKLDPGSTEFNKALNATSEERQKMYLKYGIK
ncbi:hypothetical protein [Oribacterium sp. P6A1]|uniref:hypothetical protein n=1 Tax=Oribacterium sp. P6A1 TaxID=1410612 RepID=UPI00069173DB|nr:hypothetical protein [Oribacterium sp. P6A1]